MYIKEFKKVANALVTDNEEAFNAEEHIAVISQPARYEYAFSAGCNKIYNKLQTFKVLYPKNEKNAVLTYITGLKGTLTSEEPDFERIMREEGLQNILGATRLNRITFLTKTLTNGNYCEPCEC